MIEKLEADALEYLGAYEEQRAQVGIPAPQELYWGGYLDALCQAQGKETRSNLDWSQTGVKRMLSKEAVATRIAADKTACQGCALHEVRTQAVPGVGPLRTGLAVVGQNPGKDEDTQGKPFIGDCGKLLFEPSTGLIPSTLGYLRDHTYITNMCACLSPGNRAPLPEEVASCGKHLRWELLNVDPKVILCLGVVPANWFLGHEAPMKELKGKVLEFEHIPVVVTYHPGYLLRNRAATAGVIDDLKKVQELLAA